MVWLLVVVVLLITGDRPLLYVFVVVIYAALGAFAAQITGRTVQAWVERYVGIFAAAAVSVAIVVSVDVVQDRVGSWNDLIPALVAAGLFAKKPTLWNPLLVGVLLAGVFLPMTFG